MKINKLFGVKSITNLIYGILLFIPFVSILSRVIYVQANPFAKDSYSDKYVQTAVQLNSTNVNSLYVNGQYITYTFQEHTTQWNTYIGFCSISIDLNTLFNTQADWNRFYLYSDNQDILFVTTTNQSYRLYASDRTFNSFTYVVDLNVSSDKSIYEYGLAFIYTFTNVTLDNVFEYSIKSFTQENNLGNVDFFSWFTNMFLNQDNPTNAVYLGFTNWYLNYALLVSSGYLLFFALMWFINYVRKMLEKASYHDFGGF